MKIGSHVSSLQAKREAPYDGAIDTAARLGFDAIELIAMTDAELSDYYTADTCRALAKQVRDSGLLLSEFAAYSPYTQDVVSADGTARERATATLKHAINVCADLECPIFNLVSHWASGWSCPHPYPPSYIHPAVRGMPAMPYSKLRPTVDAGFDFASIWQRYLDMLSNLARHCSGRGVKLAIEGHANVIVSGTDAMLRLLDAIPDETIVINFDTAWHLIQRELLELSIHKLRGRIGHVHLRDADGQLNYLVPVGEGIIDWEGVFTALRNTGFDGVMSFEYAGFEDYEGVARASLDYVRRLIS